MRHLSSFIMLLALSPATAGAVCAFEPLEPQLRSADVVYVGTVLRSELVGALPSAAARPRDRRIELRHTVQTDIVLKGQPASALVVHSTWQHNAPRSKSVVEFAELTRVMPGDTLLVVGHKGEPVWLALCTPTRQWDAETAKVVYAVFPPAP